MFKIDAYHTYAIYLIVGIRWIEIKTLRFTSLEDLTSKLKKECWTDSVAW
ncbi:MAG: hypothetical protein K9L74_00755 [Candidatus Izimaplasma sp.]|nr:hypothetical protein [Candidatus Izimaplasma bacterium]